MNDLVKVEEGQLIIANKVIEQIKDLKRKKDLINEKEKELKDKLFEIMSDNNISSYESNDKTLKISCTPDNEVSTFDTERFKKDHLDLYLEYSKTTTKKGSTRITVREEE